MTRNKSLLYFRSLLVGNKRIVDTIPHGGDPHSYPQGWARVRWPQNDRTVARSGVLKITPASFKAFKGKLYFRRIF